MYDSSAYSHTAMSMAVVSLANAQDHPGESGRVVTELIGLLQESSMDGVADTGPSPHATVVRSIPTSIRKARAWTAGSSRMPALVRVKRSSHQTLATIYDDEERSFLTRVRQTRHAFARTKRGMVRA